MIRKIFNVLLATALILTTASACDKPSEETPKDDPQNQNQEVGQESDFLSESPFTLSVENLTPVDFILDVKTGDYDTQYYVMINTKEDLDTNFDGDVDASVADKLRLLVGDQLQVTDFSKVNNYFIFRGDNKITASDMWSRFLTPSNEVVAYVFGVDDYGELAAKAAAIQVTMLPPSEINEAALEVSPIKVGATQIEVKVTPDAGVENYCVFAILSRDVKEDGYYTNRAAANGTDRYYEASVDFFTTARYFNTIDFLTVDNEDLFSGEQSVVVTQSSGNNAIVPNAEYTIIAIGVDNYGYTCSKAGHLDVTTPSEAAMNLSFDVEFNDLAFSEDGFAFKVYPSDKSAFYYVNVATKASVDAVGGAENVEGVLSLFEEYGFQDNLRYGDTSDFLRFSELSVNTEYYVVLFGYNGGITSDIQLVECKTGIVQ